MLRWSVCRVHSAAGTKVAKPDLLDGGAAVLVGTWVKEDSGEDDLHVYEGQVDVKTPESRQRNNGFIRSPESGRSAIGMPGMWMRVEWIRMEVPFMSGGELAPMISHEAGTNPKIELEQCTRVRTSLRSCDPLTAS
ncbi:MAG: hypothetical protein AAF670_03415 [Planctomycetota bacterium]